MELQIYQICSKLWKFTISFSLILKIFSSIICLLFLYVLPNILTYYSNSVIKFREKDKNEARGPNNITIQICKDFHQILIIPLYRSMYIFKNQKKLLSYLDPSFFDAPIHIHILWKLSISVLHIVYFRLWSLKWH